VRSDPLYLLGFERDWWSYRLAMATTVSCLDFKTPPGSSRVMTKTWGCLTASLASMGMMAGEPSVGMSKTLTPEEFAAREPLWNAKVLKHQEAIERAEAEKQQRKRERRKWRNERERQDPAPPPASVAAPSVGRNQPCPCGSGRKFKKCCGA